MRRFGRAAPAPEGHDGGPIRFLAAEPGTAGFPHAGLMLNTHHADGTPLDVDALGLAPAYCGIDAIPVCEHLVADISQPHMIAILRADDFNEAARGGPREVYPAVAVHCATPHNEQWYTEISTQGKFLLVVSDTAGYSRAATGADKAVATMASGLWGGFISLAVYAYDTGVGYRPPPTPH